MANSSKIHVGFECTHFQASLLAALYDIVQFEAASDPNGHALCAPTLDAYEGLLDLVTGVLDDVLVQAPPYRGQGFAADLRIAVARTIARVEDHIALDAADPRLGYGREEIYAR